MPRPADTGTDFAERLAVALKVLNLSRGQLAAQVGVDKSLISRWMSGQMRPTGHNLARISEVLARAKPGFNALMWERPREEFDAFLGIAPSLAVAPAAPLAMAAQPPPQPASPSPVAELAGSARRGYRADAPLWGLGAVVAIAVIGLAVVFWPHANTAKAVAQPTSTDVSIAVLPFANMSGDAKRDYFSDGFSEELMNNLVNVAGLTVASRTDSFAFRGGHADTAEIAGKLRVRYILQGSVREDGRRIRVSAQLIDSATARSVWSQEYDRDLTDVLKLQDEIARTISGQLTHRLLAYQDRPAAKTIDPDVYRAYLQGVDYIYADTIESELQAVSLLKDVTRRQPDFADGFARLGEAYNGVSMTDLRRRDQRALAEAAFQQALKLDPENGLALAFATELYAYGWRWDEAVVTQGRLEATGVPEVLKLYSRTSLFDAFALYDHFVPTAARIVALKPLDFGYRFEHAWVLGVTGEYGPALAETREGLVLQHDATPFLAQECFDQAMLGDLDGARAVEGRLQQLFRGKALAEDLALCTTTIALKRGDLAAIRDLADRAAKQFPGDGALEARAIGFYYQQALDFDDAMTWYRRAYDRRESTLLQVPYSRSEVLSPAARRLFEDPRWKALWDQPPIKAWLVTRDAYARSLPR